MYLIRLLSRQLLVSRQCLRDKWFHPSIGASSSKIPFCISVSWNPEHNTMFPFIKGTNEAEKNPTALTRSTGHSYVRPLFIPWSGAPFLLYWFVSDLWPDIDIPGKKLGIIVSSPSIVREVLKDQDITFANRDIPAVALALAYGGSDIIWSPCGPEWRKVCVLKMLSNITLDSVHALRRREVRQSVGYLYSPVGSPVIVGEQIFLQVPNVITNMFEKL